MQSLIIKFANYYRDPKLITDRAKRFLSEECFYFSRCPPSIMVKYLSNVEKELLPLLGNPDFFGAEVVVYDDGNVVVKALSTKEQEGLFKIEREQRLRSKLRQDARFREQLAYEATLGIDVPYAGPTGTYYTGVFPFHGTQYLSDRGPQA